MTNSKSYKLLFILGFLIYLYYYLDNTETKKQTTATIESLPNIEPSEPIIKPMKKTPPPIQKAQNIPTKLQTKPTPIKNPIKKNYTRYKTPTSRVEVKIVNGWAIGHGDVIFGKATKSNKVNKGHLEPKKSKLWESFTIPYAINKDTPNQDEILKALNYLNDNTVIKFVPLTANDSDAILFVNSEEICASYLGKIGGLQPIFISSRCKMQQVLHELMHALGFVHEHSRIDRDNYLTIHWENIKEDFLEQFMMIPDLLVHNYTGSVFNFDYNSIMLYSTYAFANNANKQTITSNTETLIAPVKSGLSSIDIERLYYLYGK